MFASEWVAQMLDWDRQNPPLIGPNWMSPMEAAIRIVNWIWGYAFMGDSPAFGGQARIVFYRNLLSHGRFIMRHVEPYGNHRFSNFVGLVFLGVLFPEFNEADNWREVGIKGFCEELQRQVRSDGVHFEGSIPYHRLVLEMAATTWLLLRRNGIALPPESQVAITRMFHFTAAYLSMPLRDASGPRLARFAPQVGDADDGRLQELTPLDKRDHSYLLSLAAVLTGRNEFKLTPQPHPEAFWIHGEEGLKEYESLTVNDNDSHHEGHKEHQRLGSGVLTAPSPKPCSSVSICGSNRSVAFPESGFYVMRSNRMHIFVSCRRSHPQDVGAHVHNDHLSLTLTVDGVEFLVDSGTYTYTGDLRARNAFRSTAAHNTIVVDEQEINLLKRKDPFRLKDTAACKVLNCVMNEESDVLTALHEGYARLGAKVQRQFTFEKSASVLRLHDTVSGRGQHRLEWRFHFAPEVKVKLVGRELRAQREDRVLRMLLPPIPDAAVAPHFALRPSWYSPSYGVRQKSSVLVLSAIGELPIAAQFVLTLQDVSEGMNGQLPGATP